MKWRSAYKIGKSVAPFASALGGAIGAIRLVSGNKQAISEHWFTIALAALLAALIASLVWRWWERLSRSIRNRWVAIDSTKLKGPGRLIRLTVAVAARGFFFTVALPHFLMACVALALGGLRLWYMHFVHSDPEFSHERATTSTIVFVPLIVFVVSFVHRRLNSHRERSAAGRISQQIIDLARRPVRRLKYADRVWKHVAASAHDRLWIQSLSGLELIGSLGKYEEFPSALEQVEPRIGGADVRVILCDPLHSFVKVRNLVLNQSFVETYALPFVRVHLLWQRVLKTHPTARMNIRLYRGRRPLRRMISETWAAVEAYGIMRHVSLDGLFCVPASVVHPRATQAASGQLSPVDFVQTAYDYYAEAFQSDWDDRHNHVDSRPLEEWPRERLAALARQCGMSKVDIQGAEMSSRDMTRRLCEYLGIEKEWEAACAK